MKGYCALRATAVENLASRQSAVLASGVLTVPLETVDGTYRIHVEPQIATVVDTTAAQPRHNRPDAMTSGPGFTVLVGQVETYSLRWGVASDGQGSATVEPALPAYPAGTVVTLTATPFEAGSFLEWRHYDPNVLIDPNDPNQLEDPSLYTADANLSIQARSCFKTCVDISLRQHLVYVLLGHSMRKESLWPGRDHY